MGRKIKFEYRISLIYLVIGALWIIFSDNLLNKIASNAEIESTFQSVKGIFFVTVSAIILFFLSQNYAKKHRQISDRLSDSKEKYKALYENAPLSYQSLDIDGFFIDINPQWINTLGYRKEEVIGKWFGDFLHPDYVSHFNENFPRFKKQGYVKDVHFQMKKKDGSYIHVYYEGCIGYTSSGAFRQTYCTFKDVTAEFKANEQLRESEEKFQALFDESVSIMLVIDSETGKIQDANKSAIDFYGYSINELREKRIQDINILSNEEIGREIDKIKRNKSDHYRFKHQLASGEIKDVDVHATTIKIGNKSFIYSIIFDITEKLRTERELLKARKLVEESEKKFRAAFFTSPDSVNINTLSGHYVEINKGFTQLTGYTREEVIGVKSSEIEIWHIPADRKRLIQALKTDGQITNLESVFKMKDGRLKTALMSATIIQFKGEPHVLSITRDISDRKRMENELVKAKEKAEESDRLKSAFLANMSHEIRTPLNGVLGFANILADGKLPPETVKRYAHIISKSGHRLLELINNILDISKIESGNMLIESELFAPATMIDDVIDLFKINANDKHLRILKSAPNPDLKIKSDLGKINQVLSNLLSNAIKFTKEGYIVIGFYLESNHIVFYVKDTGIGIETAIIPNLFNRFYQASTSLTRGHEGSGLGLSLCKSMVELLNGKIWVESEVGKGSEFKFKIPIEPINKEE